MKPYFITFLLLAISFSLQAQRGTKRKKERPIIISASVSINKNPKISDYSFSRSLDYTQLSLDLTYLTDNAGFFEETENIISYSSNQLYQVPTQLTNLGISAQILVDHKSYHEISLTQLSSQQSDQRRTFQYDNSVQNTVTILQIGEVLNIKAIGFRYEIGRFVRDIRKTNINLSFGFAFSPTYYSYKSKPYSTNRYPLEVSMHTFDFAPVTTFTAKLSKKVLIAFKVIPNFTLAEAISFDRLNPNFDLGREPATRSAEHSILKMSYSLMCTYQLKDNSKRRGRGR